MILSCQNIDKSFVGEPILCGVSFQIEKGDKLAIVGENGAGKSTLLKIITKEIDADSGSVTFANDATYGYLAQYQNDEEEGTIYELVRSSCSDLIEMEAKLHTMEDEMSMLTGAQLDTLLQRYHTLNDQFINLGGMTYESEVNGVLRGLGFDEDDFNKTMSMLSGGQKTRVSLGKLLVKKPDILFLDEPTNHLDLSSIQWLENYLLNYKGTVVLVAHDRYFLDRITDHVLDLSSHQCAFYKGNYTAFVKQKEERLLTRMREYEKQQQFISHQEEVVDKLKQFNREKSIKRAESREKMLEKVERIDKPISDEKQMNLVLAPETRSGKDVLEVKDLSKSYDGQVLFRKVSMLIERGEHVAILGDNGTGKTTFLKIINGMVKADAGSFKIGTNVTIGYYDQEQQVLDDNKTLFDEMRDAYPTLTETKIRNVLAAFLFTGDDVHKLIKELSGGERGRVSLAKLMLSNANFLILDEPTNHLDMESKGILENALNSYTGTVLYVSHDRYFINQTAHRILELESSAFHNYLGNYDYYLGKKAQTTIASDATDTESEITEDSQGKIDWKEQKRLQSEKRKIENKLTAIEDEITSLESQIADLNAKLQDPNVATNSAKLNELLAKISALQEKLDLDYQTWEELSVNNLLNN